MSAIIEVRGVTKRFGGITALSDASIDVPEQGVLGLIGPNGAGKTTLFNVISGHLRADRGTVTFRGQRIERRRASRLARLGMARSWQDVGVLPGLTVLDNVLIGRRTRHSEYPIWGLVRWRAARAEERQARWQALEALHRVGLADDIASAQVDDLAFAEQKLVAMARLLVAEPKVLLLDEPASGLDTDSVDRLLRVIGSIAGAGVPVLLVEHNLAVVRKVADRAVFMSNGRVVAVDTPDNLVRRDDLIELYFGSRWTT
ncbi:MAG: ATP-binding cassette domain-containing protein [Micromonosporaceae bacterium]|nr:ATP-binding cassette domain-containing protein [Micromonosporaceae bacterium]